MKTANKRFRSGIRLVDKRKAAFPLCKRSVEASLDPRRTDASAMA